MDDAKARLAELIDRAEHGEDFVIARAGKPAVRLVTREPVGKCTAGVWKGRITIADDFDDFSVDDEHDWTEV